MNRLLILLSGLAVFLACASLAEAHAFLDQADPAVGSTVHDSPTVLKLWFTRHLRADASSARIFAVDDQEVDHVASQVAAADPTLISVTLPKLPPGTYKVVWTAVCIDSHTTHGSYTFTIK